MRGKENERDTRSRKNILMRPCVQLRCWLSGAVLFFATTQCVQKPRDRAKCATRTCLSSDSLPIAAESRVKRKRERCGTRGGEAGGGILCGIQPCAFRAHVRPCGAFHAMHSLVRFSVSVFLPFSQTDRLSPSPLSPSFFLFSPSNTRVHECALARVFLSTDTLLLFCSLSFSFALALPTNMPLARTLARALACAWQRCPPVRRALLPSLRPSPLPQRVPRVRAPAECSAAVFNCVLWNSDSAQTEWNER